MKKIIIIILLMAGMCYGADSVVTICPDGCHYTSLKTALDAFNSFDVTALGAGDSLIFEISGTWSAVDSGEVLVDVGATDSDNGIRITSTGDARNTTGVLDYSKYILMSKNANFRPAMSLWENYVDIDGLQIDFYRDVGTTDAYGIDIESGASDEITVRNCIIRRNPTDTATSISAYGIIYHEYGGHFYCYNNLVYGFNVGSAGTGIYAYTGSYDSTEFVFNNTVAKCNIAFEQSRYGVYKNNIVTECKTGFGTASPIYADYNATDSSSLGYTPNTNDSVNAVYSFTDAGASNWTLTAEFGGVDLSSDPDLSFTTDMLGNTRSNWDRGCFEYVPAGGGKTCLPIGRQ